MFFNLLLILSLLITRFWGLNWGNGFYFHPDENNMAWGIENLAWPKMNPDFFAYGQFPLYLVYFTYQIARLILSGTFFHKVPFPTAVILLRFWSATFSSLSVLLGYFLAREIFKRDEWAKIYALFLVFVPGLIQLAHFGTTESILTFTN